MWTGLGIVAAELLLALAITNHYRNRRISYWFWRRAHYVNFAVWTAATLHGLGSGTDRSGAMPSRKDAPTGKPVGLSPAANRWPTGLPH